MNAFATILLVVAISIDDLSGGTVVRGEYVLGDFQNHSRSY